MRKTPFPERREVFGTLPQRIKDKLFSLRQSGIHLGTVEKVLLAVAALISVALLFAAYRTEASFRRTREAMQRYITCQQDAAQFEEGSDYLTNEARSFIVTGDPAHAINFVEEVEVTRRRERVLDDAAYFLAEHSSLEYLEEALTHSNELAQVESYAMRLAVSGLEHDPGDYPERIASVSLTEEDAALSPQEQRAKAMDLMFNSAYNAKKQLIIQNVALSITALVEDTEAEMIESAGQLSHLQRRETVLIVLLLALFLLAVVLTFALVIRPLYRNIRHLDRREEMPVRGTYEMRHLARIYNDILAENNERSEELSYAATHDALTGVYNRAAYEKTYKSLHGSGVGLLVVDVDKFKHFNDTYGHDVGDLVLKRVAEVLMHNFRSEDHVSRIGGDEFCVIMRHTGSSLKELVVGKVEKMNQILSKPDKGTPPITLSVGIAFSDRENPSGDLFKDADTALFRVKNNGRGGCSVY